MIKIGFGGGCHWCTEAIFLSLKGVVKVEQGLVASDGKESSFSEAVIVHYNPSEIPLRALIEVHLHTHNSTADHSMRQKYRSAIYTYYKTQASDATQVLNDLEGSFNHKIITKVYPFIEFKRSDERFANYYYSNPQKPFCKTYINPKLQQLMTLFPNEVRTISTEIL